MLDVYSSPERVGLEVVGEVSFDDDSYQFDLGVVWWHPERRVFFYAEDSGCSCPSPFEDYGDVEALGELLPLPALTAKLRGLQAREWSATDEPVPVQVSRILDRARELAR